MLNELLQDENVSMWAAVLYGIHSADEQIVAVAESQIGNVMVSLIMIFPSSRFVHEFHSRI